MRKRKTVPALALALAMVLALTAPAFAANPKSFEGYGLAVTVSDVVSEENGNVHAPANATVTITDEANAGFVDYLVCIASDGEDQEVGMRDLELNKAYTAADLNRMAQKESGGSKTFNRFTFMIGEMWGSGGSLEACYFCTVIFDGKATEPTKPAETAQPAEPTQPAEPESDFEIVNGVLTKYKGSGGAVIIPDGVTSIGDYTFSGCGSLTSVTIPASVTNIGVMAFNNCTGLTNVTIPDSVTSIGRGAFSFSDHLSSVTIPTSVTSIGNSAFCECKSLTSVTIPASVTAIQYSTFGGCVNLKDVHYGGTEAQWSKIFISSDNDPLASATIHYNNSKPAEPAPIMADPTNDALKVDGVAQVPTAYKIGGANYFQLRDVAMLLNGTKGQFSVDYDAQKQAVVIVTGQPYKPLGTELAGAAQSSTEAIVGNNDVYINGEKADLEVYKIGGANYFKIRDLGKALGFNVGWTVERGMFIESDKPYTDAD